MLYMKKFSYKLKKATIIIIVIFAAIYLYSNKPYSLYEISRKDLISDISFQNSKEYYSNYFKKYEEIDAKRQKKTVYVKQNDNISLILKNLGIEVPLIILKKSKKNCFYNLKINEEIKIEYFEKDIISIVKRNKKNECTYKLKENLIQNTEIKIIEHNEQLVFFNKIEGSFYNSAINSGLNPNEIMSLADIFGWDIDFSLDIRRGDNFGVVLKRKYLNQSYHSSSIKYAIFKNKQKTFEAYHFENKYFTKEGNSLRKQFLRAPIDFFRISSHFNRKRLHPIFKTVRPHLGTDYAAPTGTPIYSTGDGKVIFKGTKGGYGKTIIIKHGNIYSTLYAHMSKYKKGIRVGKKVKQKEVIGYVGSTGYSTGPHVHYEFRVRGKHKNSLKIKFKKGKKLNANSIKNMKKQHKINENIYLWVKGAYK